VFKRLNEETMKNTLILGSLKKHILIGIFLLSSLLTFSHGVQVRWNIVPSTGAVRIWVEHWHGNAMNVSSYPLVVTAVVGGVSTTQTYLASGSSNGTPVASLPDGGSFSTFLSGCNVANNYNNWVYWDFKPPPCNIPVT